MNSPVVTNDTDMTKDEIPSLLIPMVGGKLLLPTVSVAEMIAYQSPRPSQPMVATTPPGWYLGNLLWRGTMVPMVSIEMLNGERVAPVRPESQIIVLNNTGIHPQLPFLCFVTQGIPRLSRVTPEEIVESKDLELNSYDQMHVHIAGEMATIPNVSKLEQTVVDLFGY